MPGASLIFSPSTPDWAHIRSIESSYQVALIADNPSHLREFIVASQVAQVQALASANTQLAQVNAGLVGIQEGLSDLTWAVQEGFGAVGAALDGISGQIADLGYALEQGFTALAAEMHAKTALGFDPECKAAFYLLEVAQHKEHLASTTAIGQTQMDDALRGACRPIGVLTNSTDGGEMVYVPAGPVPPVLRCHVQDYARCQGVCRLDGMGAGERGAMGEGGARYRRAGVPVGQRLGVVRELGR